MAEVRIGTVMWPMQSWPEAGELWRRAEELGFDTAWVYDHLAWRGTTPWYDAFTTLAGVAATTSRIRLGTLVTSPNFRHPVPTAHAARTIDHISGGRLTLGIGSGSANRNSDAGVLGGPEWSRGERTGRFTEWVDLLDRLLRDGETTYEGAYYQAREVLTGPGCRQLPRVPFMIAALGPRGMRLAARQGAGWIITGRSLGTDDPRREARRRLDALAAACEAEGRDPGELRRVLVTGFTGEPWLESTQAFADLAGHYGELGFTDITVYWPRPGTDWDADMNVFEAIPSVEI